MSDERAECGLGWISDPCVRVDRERRVTFANEAAARLFGRPPDTLLGRPLAELSALGATLAPPTEGVVSDGAPRQLDVADDDRWYEARLHPAPDGAVVILADVTEPRRALAAQAADVEYLHRLVDQLPSFLWITDTELHVLRFEGGRQVLAELGEDGLVGIHMAEVADMGVMSAEQLSLALAMHRRALAGLPAHYRSIWKELVLEARVQPLRAPGGEIVGTIGVAIDVTEQTRAQERLRESEERFRGLVEHNEALIGILDDHARIVYASPSFTRVLGYTADELRALPDGWPLLHPDDVAFAREQFTEAQRRRGVTLPRPIRALAKDGRARSFAVTLTDLRAEPAVRGVVVNARDVTEELLLEAQLRHAQRVEALGLLAGGVAHDFNNLLSAILGGADLARQSVPDGTALAADLDDIRQAGVRAAALTRQLLTFSRPRARRPQLVDVRDAVRRSETLLRRLLPEHVGLDVALADEPCVVRGDAGQLEQVLMNLVVNAGDAVTSAQARAEHLPPLITLEVAPRALDSGAAATVRRGAPLRAGHYVAVSVRDAGIGMDADTVSRVFEPFFTTKPEGKGTGLGLATVFGIVKESGGAVDVESAPGVGTTFTVLLPRVNAPPDVAETRGQPAPAGAETILLVEDEALVREMARRILARHGYRVIAVRHGTDAVLAWREHGGAIDGVVTDLRMPAMGGRALVEWLRAQRPDLPLVLISGYASPSDAAEAELVEREVFLEKPFTADSLLVAVRSALDRASVNR